MKEQKRLVPKVPHVLQKARQDVRNSAVQKAQGAWNQASGPWDQGHWANRR